MSNRIRSIQRVVEPQPVVEGAGVRLRRSIGGAALNYLDPFLLLDHFESADPEDYRAGFPMHPHRGIETVTYILSGAVDHKDSLGNSGTIGKGDVQWMTAGSGILHQEMPRVLPEGIRGFQLWVNLAAADKMTAPRYQNISAAEIAEVATAEGATVRVISGRFGGVRGPVNGIAVAPVYLDVTLPARGAVTLPVESARAAFSYVFEGAVLARGSGGDADRIESPRLIVWDDEGDVQLRAGASGARFLMVSGKALDEPIARYGPFVMNTRTEIEEALADLNRGTFIR